MPRRVFALDNDLNCANAHMDEFLARIRSHLDGHAPKLRALFDTMAAEARFAHDWLSEDLARLPVNAALLEVGGGVFLLSCQLSAEGFDITAIEPTGEGFGEFRELGDTVLELAALKPTIAPCKAEDFISEKRFDFAFSLNVMEHIDLPDEAIKHVSEVLKPGASYRFLSPNYLFPYEPHFNIPTLFTKRLTRRVMRHRIESNTYLDDPNGLWRSLNWITEPRLKRFAAKDATLTLYFHRAIVGMDAATRAEGQGIRQSACKMAGYRYSHGGAIASPSSGGLCSRDAAAHHRCASDEEVMTWLK
jgi:SAM-dependent methyltransferase